MLSGVVWAMFEGYSGLGPPLQAQARLPKVQVLSRPHLSSVRPKIASFYKQIVFT